MESRAKGLKKEGGEGQVQSLEIGVSKDSS